MAQQKTDKADKKALVAIARASAGGMRDALSLLDQMLAMGKKNIDTSLVSQMLGSADKLLYFALCDAILKENVARSLAGLNKMIQTGCSSSTIASDLMQMFRDIYVAQSSVNIGEDLMCDETSAQRYYSIAKSVSAGAVIKCLEIFATLENDLRYATRPEIWLELAVAKACRIQKDESHESLLTRIERLEKQIEKGIVIENAPSKKTSPKEQEEFFPIKDDDFKNIQSQEKQEEDERKVDDNKTIEVVEEEKADIEPKVIPNDIMEQVEEQSDEKKLVEKQPDEKEEQIEEKPSDETYDIKEGRSIWAKATEDVKKQKKMRLFAPMNKAQVIGYDGQTITIAFETTDTVSEKKIHNKELGGVLKSTLKKIAGKIILVSIGDLVRNDEEKKIVDDTLNAFPKGLVSIEHEE